ncbi:MAG: YrdB family protein [Bacteroidales bacterium]|nr:YrdB family protein [Bacteroidales bacterium]
MSRHPLNLFVRLLLEFASIFTFGYWGYNQADSWIRLLLAIGLPLLFATLWGVFAVRNDPSRSGKTVVATPGIIRLILELGLFGVATWMLFDLDLVKLGWLLGGITLLHYIISYDRILWLLKRPNSEG